VEWALIISLLLRPEAGAPKDRGICWRNLEFDALRDELPRPKRFD